MPPWQTIPSRNTKVEYRKSISSQTTHEREVHEGNALGDFPFISRKIIRCKRRRKWPANEATGEDAFYWANTVDSKSDCARKSLV